jgi:hypothetical protein
MPNFWIKRGFIFGLPFFKVKTIIKKEIFGIILRFNNVEANLSAQSEKKKKNPWF